MLTREQRIILELNRVKAGWRTHISGKTGNEATDCTHPRGKCTVPGNRCGCSKSEKRFYDTLMKLSDRKLATFEQYLKDNDVWPHELRQALSDKLQVRVPYLERDSEWLQVIAATALAAGSTLGWVALRFLVGRCKKKAGGLLDPLPHSTTGEILYYAASQLQLIGPAHGRPRGMLGGTNCESSGVCNRTSDGRSETCVLPSGRHKIVCDRINKFLAMVMIHAGVLPLIGSISSQSNPAVRRARGDAAHIHPTHIRFTPRQALTLARFVKDYSNERNVYYPLGDKAPIVMFGSHLGWGGSGGDPTKVGKTLLGTTTGLGLMTKLARAPSPHRSPSQRPLHRLTPPLPRPLHRLTPLIPISPRLPHRQRLRARSTRRRCAAGRGCARRRSRW